MREDSLWTALSHTRIRPGHYLWVDARGGPTPDAGYARVERVEHLPADVLFRGADPPAKPPSAFKTAAVVWCQGLPGGLILHRGNHHRVLHAVPRARMEYDEHHPTWEETDTLLRGAALVQDCADPVDDLAPPVTKTARHAATFTKPASALLPGDYLRVHRRHPNTARGVDEGFSRVLWTEHLLEDAVERILTRPRWAHGRLVAVAYADNFDVLLLPDVDVDVLTAPNIERVAMDRGTDTFDDTFRRRFEDATEPDRASALVIDARLRPQPPAGEALLYPTLITDPHERALLLEGIEGLRSVPLSALPYPHHLFKCAHADRVKALVEQYPDAEGADRAAHAHAFSTWGPDDFRACEYHRGDWAAIALAAERALAAGGDTADMADRAGRDPELDDHDRECAASLIYDPIAWSDGDEALVNGQHRLCALRAAGAVSCPVDGRHLPDTVHEAIKATPSAQARAHAAGFWRRYVRGLGRFPLTAARAMRSARVRRRLRDLG
ncbi:hypothetical protein B4N89_45240 [Embleya scabrispora]|uniref:Uncharacterized protein n=1 Tax=Embleya scabrispora TaxID=159449 RepID=A0A1T3NIJ4_9ACTN|nr:hypothetical protein [Embleya scabrispora]OPC76696.1 hypothetical protein B4N89_45240 [Embleya scabrispora]